jgi:phage baseplate assembly protein W
MQYVVTPLKEMDFGATGVKEILQNVSFILSTMPYSCPLDRGFGWEPDIDSPIHLSSATSAARIAQAIYDYEPRVVVDELIVEGNALDGETKAIIRLSIDESVVITDD